MLSDESSSDSETGRFKTTTSERAPESRNPARNNDSARPRFDRQRERPSDNDRMRRDFDRRRDERDRFERHKANDRRSRHSPARRRYSRERSRDRSRRSHDRVRHREDRGGSKNRIIRSSSKDKPLQSRLHKSPDPRRDDSVAKTRTKITTLPKVEKVKSRSSSLESRNKKSVVQKPVQEEASKRQPDVTVAVDKQPGSDGSDEVQPGSYYSMIPAVIKEKPKEVEVTIESSEIDSSDDEKLRAKLLNLEQQLSKTKKRKHKRKHKKKSRSKSDKDRETSTSVEVTSTTDIQENANREDDSKDCEIVDVTSTQKNSQNDSSEEGEISSEDDSQSALDIDPSDLRHKLKSTTSKHDSSKSPDLRERLKNRSDVCGPALPPHLEKQARKESPNREGPALPPHLKDKRKNIGPVIPNEMRKVLAEADRDVVKYESSDEDVGIGPLPTGSEDKWTDAHQRLEERALDIKIRKMDGHTVQSSDVKSREQWMLELPEGKAKIIGLEARSFRAKEGPDMSDRSSWTDTPEQKARKAAGLDPERDSVSSLRKEAHIKQVMKRDEEQDKDAKKHKKKHKREESLLDLHQKKLKKKKKKEEKDDDKKERRPFSRDNDLQVNRFDEAQKKSIIKKAQALDSRFSRGEAKYL